MDEAVSSGARPHWEVSESLKSPWLEDAYIESVRLMRVFMDASVDELLANRGEFYAIVNAMWGAVTEAPCWFRGEDRVTLDRFHAWLGPTLTELYGDGDFIPGMVEGFDSEGCP